MKLSIRARRAHVDEAAAYRRFVEAMRAIVEHEPVHRCGAGKPCAACFAARIVADEPTR